jgi:hypothetical protein
MFNVGDVVSPTAGVMRGRRLTVSYVGQRKVHEALGGGFFLYYRCLNEFGEEYLYPHNELDYYVNKVNTKPAVVELDYTEVEKRALAHYYEDISIELLLRAGLHVKHSVCLFNALSMSVADLSIRHAVASIPNIIEE